MQTQFIHVKKWVGPMPIRAQLLKKWVDPDPEKHIGSTPLVADSNAETCVCNRAHREAQCRKRSLLYRLSSDELTDSFVRIKHDSAVATTYAMQ